MSQIPSTCIKCGLDDPPPTSCINCLLAYHTFCGMYALNQNDEEIYICSSCSIIPEIRNKFSLPPSISRSNSNSSISSVKRKKSDLESLHQNALMDTQNLDTTSIDNNNNKDSTPTQTQFLNEYSTHQELILALSSPAPAAPADTNSNQQKSVSSQPYSPKPLLKVKDINNFNIQELHGSSLQISTP